MFLKSFFLGWTISMPVGPLALLCIKNTLNHGIWGGISLALGIAFADMMMALIAQQGLHSVAYLLNQHQIFFQFLTGVVCCVMGFKEMLISPQEAKNNLEVSKKWFLFWFSKSFLLTLANPFIFFILPTFLVSIGHKSLSFNHLPWLLSGIFLGSLAWWMFLILLTLKTHAFFSKNFIQKIKYGSGFFLLVLGFGFIAFACYNGFQKFF